MIILTVDDDKDDHEIFCEAVKELNPNARCLSAYDGHEALELLSKLTVLPDVMFLDINMRGMNGLDLIAFLTEMDQYKSIPMVVFSTSAKLYKQKMENFPVSAFIDKPSGYNEFKQAIKPFVS